jgi:toxin ParE1/3/4
MQIVWTAPALNDVAALRAYVARDNAIAAEGQVRHVLAAVVGLAEFPGAGRPGRRNGTRELVIGRTPYIVPYRVRGETIEILRVLHGRQRWPQM